MGQQVAKATTPGASGAKGDTNKDAPEVKPETYDGELNKVDSKKNFLMDFQKEHKIHSVDFMRIWKNYDKDKNGYIEEKELSHFLKDLLQEKGQKTDKKTVTDYMMIMLACFDVNKDRKLEIGEMAQLLPVEQNFLAKFPVREKCTRKDFNEVFSHYDKDESGFIGHTELLSLLRDIFQKEGPRAMPMPNMDEYADGVFEIYDTSKDGRLSREELGLILSKGSG